MGWIAIVGLTLAAGCGEAEHDARASSGGAGGAGSASAAKPPLFGEGPPPAVGAAAQAAELYRGACAGCHGERGGGDGAMAGALTPRPTRFADAAWQAAATDEAIAKSIVEGGAAVGKSAAMPARGDLAAQPELLGELVKLVRGFGGR